MGLEGLDLVEVGTLTLREAVLSVELKLGHNNGVKTPAMHVKSRLGKHEGSGIGKTRHTSRSSDVKTIGILEETRSVHNIGVGSGTSEGMDSIRKSINGISIVERLGTKGLV